MAAEQPTDIKKMATIITKFYTYGKNLAGYQNKTGKQLQNVLSYMVLYLNKEVKYIELCH